MRFAELAGARRIAPATSDADGSACCKLTYGDAATLWRINLGWRRRKDKDIHGFVLDTERGYWASNKEAVETIPRTR